MEKQEKKIKYGLVVPLIGGMGIANEKATGEKPSFILSYDAFASNDAHCVNRYNETPYVLAEAETNEIRQTIINDETGEVEYLSPFNEDLFEEVDFVSAVCPCAGLSMLNSNNNKEAKAARGADAAQNDWMYKSARLVLEKVQPKVFWGENAPGLYTTMGEKVVERLREIGKEYGYSFSMIKTDTFVHGIPQHRQRTFYFFWKGDQAPLLNYYEREAPLLKDYLDLIPENASYQDKSFGLENLNENGFWRFIKSKGVTIEDLLKDKHKTMFQWIFFNGYRDEAIEFAQKEGDEKMVRFLEHTKRKEADKKGWWDGSPLIFNEATNAIIAKNSGIVRPGTERGINLREAMWLMGLPHDFEMVGGINNHICQNVPVQTATDWTSEVIRYVKGEVTEWGGEFVKQNNVSKKIDYAEHLQKSAALF